MPLNQNTVLPADTTVRFVNGEGMIMQEQRIPVGENVQYFVNETPNIHRVEPYVRFNYNTEATFTAANAMFNEDLLRQLIGDFEARMQIPEYQPYDKKTIPEKELADVDPNEFDKILSA